MKVRINGESIVTINDRNYFGGQEIDITDEQYEEVKDKVDVINTSTIKMKLKKETIEKDDDNIEQEEDE